MTDDSMLAGRFVRLVATAIDAVLVPTLTIFGVMVFGVVEDAEDYQNRMWMVWVLLIAIGSYSLLNGYGLWRRGQTLGKQIMSVAIVSASASVDQTSPAPAPFWKLVCIRALFFPLLFVIVVPWVTLVPFIDQLLIFTKRRRCLHDLVSGTMVVRADKR